MMNFYNQSFSLFENSQNLRSSSLKSAQSGRSMIEMLGVLAIIGVLSVGGIAGYSKAMTKFKINKTIEQISHIVANTRTLYGSQPNYGLLQCGAPSSATNSICKKAKLVPDDMWETGSSNNLVNAFGGSVSLYNSDKVTSGDKKAFYITFSDLPEDACIELATQDWGAATGSGLIAVGLNGSAATTEKVNCSGRESSGSSSAGAVACPNGSSVSVPMPISVAATACDGDKNYFVIKYY